jgi:hypothetical protein
MRWLFRLTILGLAALGAHRVYVLLAAELGRRGGGSGGIKDVKASFEAVSGRTPDGRPWATSSPP